LAEIDALDVLEFIDFHPETISRDGSRVRAACPIHRDSVFRTLVVEHGGHLYRCSKADCPGHEGGDLIDLLARSRRLQYDEALRLVIDEFQLDIDLPEDSAALEEAMAEVRTYMDLMVATPDRREAHAEEARTRLEQILEQHGEELGPLRARIELAREMGDAEALQRWLKPLAEAEREDGDIPLFTTLALEYLDLVPSDLELRRRIAVGALESGHTDQAVEQLMILADAAEMAGELGTALEAYRLLTTVPDSGMDATPMIDNLLMALGNRGEAAREVLARAEQHIVRNEHNQAMALLETAMEADPTSPIPARRLNELLDQFALSTAQVQRALAAVDRMMNADWWDEARDTLLTIAQQYPEETGVLSRLIKAHENVGDFDLAAEMQDRLIAILRRNERFGEARSILDSVLELYPRDKRALRQYGEIAAEEVDFDAALTHFRSLGQILEEDGAYEEAEAVYHQMVLWRRGDARTCASLVRLLQQLDRGDESIALIEEAINAARSMERHADLANLVQLALSIDSAHPAFLIESARLLERGGDMQRGLDQHQRACRFLLKEGRHAEAEREARQLLGMKPNNVDAIEIIAEALTGQSRARDARSFLSESAGALTSSGDFAGARRLLERLAEEDPNDADVLSRLVTVCISLDDRVALARARQRTMALLKGKRRFDEAITQGEALVELLPDDPEAARELLELYRLADAWDRWEPAAMRLARLLRAGGDHKGETKLLREVLRQQPQHLAARESLLELLAGGSPGSDMLAAVEDYRVVSERLARTDEAAAFLNALAEQHSGNTALRQILIDIYGHSERPDDQAEQIGKLLETLEARDAVDEMIPLYHSLVEIRPNDHAARKRLGELLLRAERRAEGLSAMMEVARAAMTSEDPEDAAAALEIVLENDAENEEALTALARAEFARGHKASGCRALRSLAAVHQSYGRLEEALAVLTEGIEADPASAELRRDFVGVCRAVGSPERTALALENLEWLANHMQTRGDEKAAFTFAREAIELDPENEERRRKLITQLIRGGHHQMAQDELVDLAEIDRAVGRIDSAMAVLEESLALDANHVRTRSIRAELFEEIGDEKAALGEWRALAPLLRDQGRESSDGRTLASGLRVLPEYTFEQFVVSEHNRFAHATAQAVSRAPGQTPHNPLFLHADVGLGKTHILHAIANHMFREFPQQQVLYTNAEDFTTELVEAISSNGLAAFRQRYKRADVLLIDDIQFLAGNESAQNEFFHVFNTLYQAKKQIVISSDRPPRALEHLEKRLRSRFGSGVIIDIQHPDLETRLAILLREARDRGRTGIAEDALRVLANAFDANIRELKGALNQLLLRHDVGGETLDADTARRVVAGAQA
jgi:chromosomal replication initiation ATPase DnaA/predicted Zn-dependent protease